MRTREPLGLGIGLALVWIMVIAVIALAAGDAEPTIAAGSVVTALGVAMFAVSIVAGGLGRPFEWSRYLAIAVSGTLAVAVLVAAVARWRLDAVIFVPIVALIAGMIGWLLSWTGWLVGSAVRVALGKEEEDTGIL